MRSTYAGTGRGQLLDDKRGVLEQVGMGGGGWRLDVLQLRAIVVVVVVAVEATHTLKWSLRVCYVLCLLVVFLFMNKK